MYHAFSKAKVARIPLIVSSEPQVNDFFIKRGFRKGKHVDSDLVKYAPPYSGFGVFHLVNLIWKPRLCTHCTYRNDCPKIIGLRCLDKHWLSIYLKIGLVLSIRSNSIHSERQICHQHAT